MALNKNIKTYRKKSGLTQKALAEKAGLSFSMVSKLESGEQLNPSVETLNKLAGALKITPEKLLYIPSLIEEQIDDYIKYKRGLDQSEAGSKKAEAPEPQIEAIELAASPCSDLNFRKKLQAINLIPRPPETPEDDCLSCLQKRPEIKKLVSSLRDASKEEIEQVLTLVATFHK